MLKIVADSKIPFTTEAFSSFAEIVRTTSEDLGPQTVRQADALLVRSESRVNAELLEGSKVRFVGSCTIGTDHVDLPYLESRSIPFANAPGCNARSVAEYVMSCILETLPIRGRLLDELRLGIIGFGNVGSRVGRLAGAMGLETVVNDPPLQASGGGGSFWPLAEVLKCDIVTVHVPLEREGDHPTFHLIGSDELSQLPPHALLINTSRGPVLSGAAVLEQVRSGDLRVVLDVWENEPEPDLELVKLVEFGTPHIAGYSLDGKLRGTKMVHDALCRAFEVRADWTGEGLLPSVQPAVLDLAGRSAKSIELLTEAVRGRYRIQSDSRRMLPLLSKPAEERGAFFRNLRRTYPTRREFPSLGVRVPERCVDLANVLKGLGMRVIV